MQSKYLEAVYFFSFLKVHLFVERESANACGGGAEREFPAGSVLLAWSLTQSSIP